MAMITLAQIGCGYWGPNLLRNFSAQADAHVKYVVESSEERRRYVRDNYPHTQAGADLAAVLTDASVQAVIVATPARSHFELARLCLQAGRHVFVEKPLAMSVTEVDGLATEATRRGLTLMVGHTFLYNPAVLYLKRLIEAGELGRIYYLYSRRLNLGVVRSDVNALWNLAPHDVSIFNFLLGHTPQTVAAHGTAYLQEKVEDVVFANLEYPGGVRASLHVSWLDPNKVRQVTLVGSRKMVVYDDIAERKLAIYDKGIDAPGSAGPADPLPFDQPPRPGRLVYRSGEVHFPEIPEAEPLHAEARDFLEAITQRRPPRSGVESGRGVVATLQAATLSLVEDSRRVSLAALPATT